MERTTLSILALLLIALSTIVLFMPTTLSKQIAPPAIYRLLSVPIYRVFPVNSSYLLVATSTLNGELLLYNIVDRKIVAGVELYGKIVSIAASSVYNPKYVVVGTSKGELTIVINPSHSFKVTSMRFHGSTTIEKVGTSSNLVYALVMTGNIPRFLVIEPNITSWCEISPYWTNMLLSSKSQTLVLDFVQALTPSGNQLFEYSDVVLLAVKHVSITPSGRAVFLNIVPVVNKTIVRNAVVKVVYDNTSAYYNLSKVKAIPIPLGVHRVLIEVYYFNRSSGLTYFGNRTLIIPRLPPGTHFLLTIELQKMNVAIPLPTTSYRLLIVKFDSVYSCAKSFLHPLANISIPLLWGSKLSLNLFYLNGSKAIIVAYIKNPFVNILSLKVYVINVLSHRVVWQGTYPISTTISASAISNDGKLLVVGLSNGILYVLRRTGTGFMITASYRLPSVPSSIRILNVGHERYLVLVGCYDGSLVMLLVQGSGKLVPVNRGSNTLALKLGSSPLSIAVIPTTQEIVVSSNEGMFLIVNIVQNLYRILGSNLALYLTKPLRIAIISRQRISSYTIYLHSLESAIPVNLNITANTVYVPAIAIGVHRLVIQPSSPLQPRISAVLSLSPRALNIEASFSIHGLKLPFSATTQLGKKLRILSTNTTVLNITTTYGETQSITINFNPIHVMGYSLRIFNSAKIVVSTAKYLSIEFVPPTWLRARTVVLCLRPPRGAIPPNTTVAIVGVLSHVPIILSYNPRIGCFEAHNVPYDVYRIELLKAPPAYTLPRNAILVVNRATVRYLQPLLLKPTTISIRFVPAPRTALKLYIGSKVLYVEPGTKVVKLSIYPGIYTLKVEPLPTIYTFNKAFKIPYYGVVVERIAVPANKSILVKLQPSYIWVTLVIVDKYTHSPPLYPIKLYVNNVYVATVVGHNYMVSGYISNTSPTRIKLVPLTPCYKETTFTVDPIKMHLHNGSKIYIAVPRNRVKLVLEIYSSLGTPIDGALVGIHCGPLFSTVTVSSNGRATAMVPADTTCSISVEKLGYYPRTISVFVGTSETKQLIVLKPTPLTIVRQYMNIIAAGIVIGIVVAVALYLKKRIEQKLASATATI